MDNRNKGARSKDVSNMSERDFPGLFSNRKMDHTGEGIGLNKGNYVTDLDLENDEIFDPDIFLSEGEKNVIENELGIPDDRNMTYRRVNNSAVKPIIKYSNSNIPPESDIQSFNALSRKIFGV